MDSQHQGGFGKRDTTKGHQNGGTGGRTGLGGQGVLFRMRGMRKDVRHDATLYNALFMYLYLYSTILV